MTEDGKKTASYKIIFDAGGNRYRFFCERSGLAVCTTQPFRAETSQQELMLAWDSEGKKNFNLCPTCGRWVSDAMYNPDTLECVICSPLQQEPMRSGFGVETMKQIKVCKVCGAKAEARLGSCNECGIKLSKDTLYDIYRKQSSIFKL